jgi:ABC-type uncharacterized transport system fused permease/ATPase subunit
MSEPRPHALFGRRFLGEIRRLMAIYWTSPDVRWGALLLAGAIVLELGTVYGNLLLSDAERRIMDAVQDNEPDWVFLDKATSALDEEMEKRIYQVLAERLPRATVVSVAHCPAVVGYHGRCWRVTPNEHGASSLEAA